MLPLKTIETLQWQQNAVLKVERVLAWNGIILNNLGDSFISLNIIECIWQKMGYVAIARFFRSFKRAKTNVDHRTRIWGKTIKKAIDDNGQSV